VQNRIHFTDISIRNLQPSDRTIYLWDRDLRGFGIRVGKNAKTFVAVKDDEFACK